MMSSWTATPNPALVDVARATPTTSDDARGYHHSR